MFLIEETKQLAPDVKWFRIAAPLVAHARRPGQFVIVRLGDAGERIPLTIADADPARGTIELIVKAIGATTERLCRLGAGDAIADVSGPLGRPTDLISNGTAVLVGGGVGTAVIYPLAQAMRRAGCRVVSITGGRTRDLVILEAELARVSDVVHVCTDDGSHGFHGNVGERLQVLLAEQEGEVDAVFAAGPVPMLEAVADATRPADIRTVVSLNPIMVDGTGMCGGCRVTVAGETRFACVDGPEFDGHQVDYEELAGRLATYRRQEALALKLEHEGRCRLKSTGNHS